MFSLRCRAVPALRTAVPGARTQMNSLPKLLAQPKAGPSSLLASRPFSSFLSTPTRPTPTQAISNLLSIQTTTSSVLSPSSLASQLQQTRSFSASASLGVRRNTFRPSRRVQKRRSGFLSRNKTSKGRQVLAHRRSKGRKFMSW